MTVIELIKVLASYNPHARVIIFEECSCTWLTVGKLVEVSPAAVGCGAKEGDIAIFEE